MKKNNLVVFCGMDGSGKSTLASKLVTYFKQSGVKTEYIHGHNYKSSKNSFGFTPKQVSRFRYLFRLLIPFAFIDNLCTYFFEYRKITREKTLVCDRYFYDKVVRMLYYGISNRFIAKIYLKLLPQADFIFFLDIAPECAVSRKAEYSLDKTKIFRDAYLFVAKHVGATLIDTNRPVEVCFKEIKENFRNCEI